MRKLNSLLTHISEDLQINKSSVLIWKDPLLVPLLLYVSLQCQSWILQLGISSEIRIERIDEPFFSTSHPSSPLYDFKKWQKYQTFLSTFPNSLTCTRLSLAVHPEKSQCGNRTKLNTKLRQLYLSFSNMFLYPLGNYYHLLLLLLLEIRAKVFWLQTAHISSLPLWPYE